MDIRKLIEREVLPFVLKPGRYIGGEAGAAVKEDPEVEVRIALAFPDVYEIGMSHLGLKILYSIINANPRMAAERVFAPWPDMEAKLRERGIPLYSLERFAPLSTFDVIGFSLQYELTYTNILTMLDLGGVPVLGSERRAQAAPLVIAGGPGAYNPAPLEDFIDLFVIGDAEETLPELMEAVARRKRVGATEGKEDFLARLARDIRGLYAPSLYRRIYSKEGALLAIEPGRPGVPRRVLRRAVRTLESSRWLSAMPVPNISIVHDRVAMEVRRGCGQGCRFCQAGVIYRPVRDEKPESVFRASGAALRATGYDEMALCALSVGDYPPLRRLAGRLLGSDAGGPVWLSLPSLRPDRLSGSLAKMISRGRRSGITLAPEAGTEAMRRALNKKISVEDLLGFVAELREAGWRTVKLYFMMGLPGEKDEDLAGIAETIERVRRVGRGARGRWEIHVTVALFIPKPHTPFQREPMAGRGEVEHARAYLRRAVRGRGVTLRFHDTNSSILECAFSRGDRNLGAVLLRAWRAGCRFDAWAETLDFSRWRQAFAGEGLDPDTLAGRRFGNEEALPWDVIDTGVSREFIIAEREKAERGILTPDCSREGCQGCGACEALGMGPDCCRDIY